MYLHSLTIFTDIGIGTFSYTTEITVYNICYDMRKTILYIINVTSSS